MVGVGMVLAKIGLMAIDELIVWWSLPPKPPCYGVVAGAVLLRV
jgi:hypothetical protein